MDIIRYSVEGFKSQEQTHHAKHIKYCLYDFNLNDFPEHLRWEIEKNHIRKKKFFENHLDDFKSGIWCFVKGYKSNQALNHLKRKVPCWQAEVPNDIECYDCNWDKLTTISDIRIRWGGCFIPERELYKIHNIRRLNS